jgi:hypothetical protein
MTPAQNSSINIQKKIDQLELDLDPLNPKSILLNLQGCVATSV